MFLGEQNYPAKHSDSVEHVITITGTCDDGQALTLAQYLTQTWPSIGPIMLKMIKNVICFGTDHVQVRKFSTIPPSEATNLSFLSTRRCSWGAYVNCLTQTANIQARGKSRYKPCDRSRGSACLDWRSVAGISLQ